MKRPFAVLSLLAGACSSGGEPTDPTDPGRVPWAFRASLIDPALIQKIKPLGNMSPNGHWMPTDHIYFQVADPDLGQSPVVRRTAFFAPADGIVADVFTSPTAPDVGLRIRVTTTVYYTLGHVIPDIPLARGTRVRAGQRLGTTGSVFSIDLGLFDEEHPLPGFVNPARLGPSAVTAAPLRHYDEPLRALLYSKVERMGPELDGKIDYDVPGRLVGSWFMGDVNTLSFAYDTYDPARVVISAGGGLSQNGVFTIAAADPRPRDVSVASGLTRYTLSAWGETGQPLRIRTGVTNARMLVEMLDDRRIRVELFPVSATALAFTTNAKEFVR